MRQVRTGGIAALLLMVSFPIVADAQPPFRFKFKPGMVLRYETVHDNDVQIQTTDDQSSTTSRVEQLKEWKVIDVDSRGVATLELTIRRLKLVQTEPDGTTVRYDSTDWQSSHKDLIDQLGKLVEKPVLRVQVAKDGTVKHMEPLGEQRNLPKELPFHVSIPEDLPKVGMTWSRHYAISLDPPIGNGQAFKASQICELEKMEGNTMVISTETALSDSVESVEDRMSLIHMMPKGQVTLDTARGVLLETKQEIDQSVDNFAGPGTIYIVKTKYTEKLVEDIADSRK